MTKVIPSNSFRHNLVVGLPHTNMNGLSEVALLMHAGHFQWNGIAEAAGKPLSQLLTREGQPIYATYYYVEEEFPQERPLNTFMLEDSLVFWNCLKHFKDISLDGVIVFDRSDRLPSQ